MTPRPASGPVATPTPSQLFLTSSVRRGYTDEIESSPPASPAEGSAGSEEEVGEERGRKRRRLSASPGPDEDEPRLGDSTSSPSGARVRVAYRHDDIEISSPESPVNVSDKVRPGFAGGDSGDGSEDLEPREEEDPGRERISISPGVRGQARARIAGEDVGWDAIADTEDDSPGPPSEPWDIRGTRRAPQQPKFQAPPPFKQPDLRPEDHLEGLPPAFSPQRKGSKYVPGGLAAEVQGWLSHIKGSREAGARLRIRVSEIREGGRMYIIRGRKLAASGLEAEGHAGEGAEVRALLAGEGELTGLGESMRVTEGCVVEAGGLRWDVELDGLGRWTVACDWRVAGDAAS